MWNARMNEAELESRLLGKIAITWDMQMTPHLTVESEEELKILLMKVQENSEKVSLKLNIQKTKTMESSPITPWHIDLETMETVRYLIFLSSKITEMVIADMKLKDACSLEEKPLQT